MGASFLGVAPFLVAVFAEVFFFGAAFVAGLVGSVCLGAAAFLGVALFLVSVFFAEVFFFGAAFVAGLVGSVFLCAVARDFLSGTAAASGSGAAAGTSAVLAGAVFFAGEAFLAADSSSHACFLLSRMCSEVSSRLFWKFWFIFKS